MPHACLTLCAAWRGALGPGRGPIPVPSCPGPAPAAVEQGRAPCVHSPDACLCRKWRLGTHVRVAEAWAPCAEACSEPCAACPAAAGVRGCSCRGSGVAVRRPVPSVLTALPAFAEHFPSLPSLGQGSGCLLRFLGHRAVGGVRRVLQTCPVRGGRHCHGLCLPCLANPGFVGLT